MSKQMSREQKKQVQRSVRKEETVSAMSKPISRQQTRHEQRKERREEQLRREHARKVARHRRNIFVISIVVCAVVIAGVIIGTNLMNKSANTTTANTQANPNSNPLHPNVDNISCDTLEHTAYHIHAHLSIFKDGQPVTVPQGIGLATDGSCYYWLHTHDAAGIIHIEAPASNDGYTLGTFLKLWSREFADLQYPTQLSAIDGWVVYVDGKPYSGDFNKIVLTSHELITLAYNSPHITPESKYNWPADLVQ